MGLPIVADYMATDLVTLTAEMEINKAMTELLDKRVSGAPVVDDQGRVVGMLSKKDCLRAAFSASYHREWGGTVAEYMTKDVQTLHPDATLLQAVETFLAGPYRRFPVLRDGQLVGQISRADVLQALVDQWVPEHPRS